MHPWVTLATGLRWTRPSPLRHASRMPARSREGGIFIISGIADRLMDPSPPATPCFKHACTRLGGEVRELYASIYLFHNEAYPAPWGACAIPLQGMPAHRTFIRPSSSRSQARTRPPQLRHAQACLHAAVGRGTGIICSLYLFYNGTYSAPWEAPAMHTGMPAQATSSSQG